MDDKEGAEEKEPGLGCVMDGSPGRPVGGHSASLQPTARPFGPGTWTGEGECKEGIERAKVSSGNDGSCVVENIEGM